MSIMYTLFENRQVFFGIYERFNRLSLGAYNSFTETTTVAPPMEPAEMGKLLLEGLKVVSYFMGEEDFNDMLKAAEFRPIPEDDDEQES